MSLVKGGSVVRAGVAGDGVSSSSEVDSVSS